MEIKERTLARTTPPDTEPGRYRPPDSLLTALLTTVFAHALTRTDDICALAGQRHHEAAVAQFQYRTSGRADRYGVFGGQVPLCRQTGPPGSTTEC